MARKGKFDQALATLAGRAFDGTCHRVVALSAYEAGNPQALLYDQGPKLSKSGQRFSPPGDHAGLYLAVEKLTAGSEFAGSLEAWNQGDCPTNVTFRVQVRLKTVLDLTDPAVLKELAITTKDVQSAWEGYMALFKKEPITWILGRAAHACGKFDGVLFRSTKNPAGTNLLVFTGLLKKGESDVVLFADDGTARERLPK